MSRAQSHKVLTRSITGSYVCSVGPLSFRVRPRSLAVGLVVLAGLLVLSVVTLMMGTLQLSAAEVVGALLGQGEPQAIRTVFGRRLPRLITALCVGAALAIAGAIFQSVSRNPLGSPDIIGFTSGAAAGAIIQITAFGGGLLPTALGATAGGVVTAAAVYGLARRDGVTGGLRLVLVGIGVGAVASAITTLMVVRSDIDDATAAQSWLAGTLLARGWPHALSIAAILAALALPLLVVAGRLRLLELGDELASGVGVRVERARLLAVLLGVVLTSVAVAATGPIAFIALAAPQIAARLTHRSSVQLVAAALVGAALLVMADLISQGLDIGLRTPVGTVTALLGGVYLVWLLARRA